MLIELKNLKKTYFTDDVETKAVRGLSFSIKEGEFVAIMGPSGSGKSTLLHMLGFLDYPTAGIYRFDGKQMKDYENNEVAKVRNEKMGFVFQSFNLLPRTSVLENVKLPLLYSSVKEKFWFKKAEKAIKEVGLEHRKDYDVSKLSGGERQRVAIARALINDPQVIFADEPTGNLDSKSGGQIMNILEHLNSKGKTIILITHETYTANYAGRRIVLKDGLLEKDEKITQRNKKSKQSFHK